MGRMDWDWDRVGIRIGFWVLGSGFWELGIGMGTLGHQALV